jgi:hypothetical protein
MAKWRKKPVVVEAEVYQAGMEDGVDKYCDWFATLQDCPNCRLKIDECDGYYKRNRPYINTLEGRHYINHGDYIISVNGDRYPCNPYIFRVKYEPAREE